MDSPACVYAHNRACMHLLHHRHTHTPHESSYLIQNSAITILIRFPLRSSTWTPSGRYWGGSLRFCCLQTATRESSLVVQARRMSVNIKGPIIVISKHNAINDVIRSTIGHRPIAIVRAIQRRVGNDLRTRGKPRRRRRERSAWSFLKL